MSRFLSAPDATSLHYPRASEQGNVIGLVSVYICVMKKNNIIERTRDLIYLKFVATDFSQKIISPSAGKNIDDSGSPCYSAVSALLMNHLPDRSNYSPLCHTHYLTPSLVSSGQTLYQAASWRLILLSSMLQCFTTVESSRELSALRKLNNKQRQVSMFLILLFKLLTHLLLSLFSSVCSLSQSSLFSLSHPPLPLLSLLINSLSS